MSLSPSSNWINSRKHDPRPNAVHATQTQNGRESSSQRSSPYLSFNNSSNLNEHTSTHTHRVPIELNKIFSKRWSTDTGGFLPCEPEGKRPTFAGTSPKKQRFYHGGVSLPLFIIRGRESSFVPYWPFDEKRKRQIYARSESRSPPAPPPSPLSPSSPNTINPPVYTINRQLLKVEIRLAKICRRRDVSISRDKTTAAVAFLSEKRKKWKMYTNPRGFRDLGDGEIFRNVATTFIIIVVRRVLEVGVG